MSDLHVRLTGLESSIASSAAGTPEFDSAAAVRSVTVRRRTRASFVSAAAAVALIGITVTTGLVVRQFNEDSPSSLVTANPPSETASSHHSSPSATADSATTVVRNPLMDDAEALERAEHPATGESWLTQAVKRDAPSFAPSDAASCEWYDVGTRGDRDILIMAGECDQFIVEANEDGTDPAILTAPFPFQDTSALAELADAFSSYAAMAYPGMRIDAETFYDTLALPESWTAADGVTIRRDAVTMRILKPQQAPESPSVDGTFGQLTLATVDRDAHVNYVDVGLDDKAAFTFIDRRYVVGLPAKGLFLEVLPEQELDADGAATPHEGSLAIDGFETDFFAVRCTYDAGPAGVLLTTTDASQWQPSGDANGHAIYTPTASSPLAQAMFAAWLNYRTRQGDLVTGNEVSGSIDTLDEYLQLPAIVGWPSEDGTGWWVQLSDAVRMQEWC